MQLKHRVALNGAQLDAVDDRIIIRRVETGDPKINVSTVGLPADGSRVTAMTRESIDVTVKFCIRLKKKCMADREAVLEKVNAWAAMGGKLTTNFKTDRKIMVFLAQPATAGDPWDWTKEYTLVFRACGVPYWQEDAGTSTSKTAVSSSSFSMTVKGSARSVLDASFKNTSGSTVNTLTLNTGEAEMSFTGLGLANNETLEIDHEDNGKRCVPRIRIKGTGGAYRSALDKRSGSNDLYVTPGSRTITLTAGGAGNLTVTSCGRFA